MRTHPIVDIREPRGTNLRGQHAATSLKPVWTELWLLEFAFQQTRIMVKDDQIFEGRCFSPLARFFA